MDPEQIPLRALHLPDAIGWWPLAPGWWVVIGLAVLGVLLAVGDQLPILRKRPGLWLFGLYWLAVLLLTFWVMLLAVGDFYSTRAHARSSLAQIRKKQRELQRQIAGIKRRRSNGQDGPG